MFRFPWSFSGGGNPRTFVQQPRASAFFQSQGPHEMLVVGVGFNPSRNKNGECLACNPKTTGDIFWITSENPDPVVLSRQDMTTFRKFRYTSGWMVTKKHFTPEIRSFRKKDSHLIPSPRRRFHASFKKNLHPKGQKKTSPKNGPHCSRLAPQTGYQKCLGRGLTVAPAIKLKDSS